MKRTVFDYEIFRGLAGTRILMEAEENNEVLTKEELQRRAEALTLQYKEEIRALNISRKLIELGWEGKANSGVSYRAAKLLAENFPEEMEQNLNEWLDDKPLTEIKYGGYSFKDMQNQYKNIELPFYYYLRNMKKFILDGKKDPGLLKVGFITL